jgi:general transcription factor IIIA
LSFNVNSNLRRHLKLHEKWGTTLRGSKKAEAELLCPEAGCGKVFKYPSLLQTHIDNVHDRLKISEAFCTEAGCGERFSSTAELRAHSKVAHCYVVCESCGVSVLKTSFKAHARTHDEEQEVLRCPHPGCQRSYNKQSNLNVHIRAVHSKLKPYGCSHAGCEKRFAYKCTRDNHEQSSAHATPVLEEGDFETEDLAFRLNWQGNRKRRRLEHVYDLLPRKWRSQLLE